MIFYHPGPIPNYNAVLSYPQVSIGFKSSNEEIRRKCSVGPFRIKKKNDWHCKTLVHITNDVPLEKRTAKPDNIGGYVAHPL